MQKQIDDEWITDRTPTPYKRVILLYRNRKYHKNIEKVGYYSTGKKRGYRTKTGEPIRGYIIGWKEI